EDASGEETNVNEEDEQAMTRGGVEPMYSGSARKREWTETLRKEEDPSCEETSVNEEDEQAMTRGGVEPMYSGSARKREWTETLRKEEDPSCEETSVNEEDEQAMTRGGVEPMYSGSARKGEWTETLPEEEDPSGEETSDDEDKEPTTSGEDPSSKEDEEATTSGGVFSGTEPKRYWSQVLPAKDEDPSGVETGVNEEDEKLCFRLVPRISPSELKIVRRLAKGGQANIFLAKYLKTGQDVVVKRYRNCQVQAGELQRQMERVMEACEKRDESGLCRVFGVSVDEKGRVSTVMQPTLTLNLNYSCRISNVLLVYYIQGEVQSRSHKIESMIQDFEEKESLLLTKIAGLELAKEQIEEGAVSDLEQLRIE
ncbi:unnamed protein product, partial [Sphagnum jensenii]